MWRAFWKSDKTETKDSISSCPVKEENSTPIESKCPVNHDANSPLISKGCPQHENQEINPRNMMEKENQTIAKGQKQSLSTVRVSSTIPKGEYTPEHQEETSETWMYPSEQQYYNAMRRKGWNPQERDMRTIVAIHNTINEQGWKEVLKWEQYHSEKVPTLVKFMGKPKDYSPKARFMNLIGYALPFDRHDWFIDRNGETIRYVIDFYSGQPEAGRPMSVYLDVRPALDSFSSVFDRIRYQFDDKILPLLPFRGEFLKSSTSKNADLSNSNSSTNTSSSTTTKEE